MSLIIDSKHCEITWMPGVNITRLRFGVSIEDLRQRVMSGEMSINAARSELGLPPLDSTDLLPRSGAFVDAN